MLRLASLLWRLRRIIAIETDLFRIQAEILQWVPIPANKIVSENGVATF